MISWLPITQNTDQIKQMKSSTTLRCFIISHYGRLIFSPDDIANNIKQAETILTGQRVELQPERPDIMRAMTATQ